jgi:hypothetical protein
MGGGGFEPPRDKPAGLQPAAFDHSATRPLVKPCKGKTRLSLVWVKVDSNHRGTNRQVYSLLPSTTQPLTQRRCPGRYRHTSFLFFFVRTVLFFCLSAFTPRFPCAFPLARGEAAFRFRGSQSFLLQYRVRM